jgi:hypothetical protein
MSFGIRVLRTLFPSQEAQRMELRRVIHEAEACAEDLSRTIRIYNSANPRPKNPINGKQKNGTGA